MPKPRPQQHKVTPLPGPGLYLTQAHNVVQVLECVMSQAGPVVLYVHDGGTIQASTHPEDLVALLPDDTFAAMRIRHHL